VKSFFRFFVERSLLAHLITLMIVLLGASTLLNIKRDNFPAVEFGELLIMTQYPGASPEDVELSVTNRIEKEIKEVTGIKRSQSWSMESASTIHIVLDPNVNDEEKVVREIREAVARVTDLPAEVTESPLVEELSTSTFPMIEIGITGDLPYIELREIARNFRKKLENQIGVSRVEEFGYLAREIQVALSPESLRDWRVSLNEVVAAIQNRNVRASGGSFESYTSEKNIVTLAQFRNPMEVNEVIVKTTFDGPLIKISDMAIVTDGFEAEKVRSRVDGHAAISFVAFKAENADIIRTVEGITAFIEEERAYLPAGVEILISDDRSTYVRNRFFIVATNGLIGLALVVLVLSFFLSFRVAFWTAIGIPVTVLGVIFLLPMFGGFLDSITMTAMVLVIGIIVDDAIIIAENIHRRAEEGLSAYDAAVEGIAEVFNPVVTTILTTLVVFAPLFFMPGMLGKFVYVIPLVIVLALLISLVESGLALPAHLAAGLRRRPASKGSAKHSRFDRMRDWYATRLRFLLRARYLLFVVFLGVLAGAGLYAKTYMDFILFPSSTADRFIIFVETPSGTSLQATSDMTERIEALVAGLGEDELASTITRIGTLGEIGASLRENNAAILVALTPFAKRERTADEIVEALRVATDRLEGFDSVKFEIDSGGPPVGRPIMLQVVGSDNQKRVALADEIYAFVQSLDGTKDIDRDDKLGKAQVEIKPNYELLARIGVSVADIARNVRIAYDGEVVGTVRYGDEDVDFRVIFQDEIRQDPEILKELMLPNSRGNLTPLGLVAAFEDAPGPANIIHFKGDRSITISGDVDQEVTTPLAVSKAVLQRFNISRDYPGLQLIVGGEAQESEESLNELFLIMGIAILGIYFLLVLLFNSLWQPVIVMIAIPFGFLGVVVGFAVHDEPLGFLAMTGIIGLAGIVVNDALVLVNHVNTLRKQLPERPMAELVAKGTSDRLRAVLLTTVSTVVGLMPLAYGIGGADPYMGPMALALGWGLLFATPLTLLLLPCLYLISEDIRGLFRSGKKRPA